MNQVSDDYVRLLEHLRTGDICFSFWMNDVSQQTIDLAIWRGDAVRENQFSIRASPQLIARIQAEEVQAHTHDENQTKPDSEPVSEQATNDETNEPVEHRKLSPRAFAAEWLRELLQEPRWVEDILRLAEENDIAFTTLKRAKKIIGAKSVKIGGYFGGEDTRWFWRLG